MLNIEPEKKELSSGEKQFLTTFNKAAVGIAHVSEDGVFIQLNQKFCDITGYSRAELMSKTFQDITYAEDLDGDLTSLHSLVGGKCEFYTMEKRYIRKDGSLVWIELTVSIVRAEGQPHYFISIIHDIGARKKAEEALREVHRTLACERELARLERDNFFNLAHDPMAISAPHGQYIRVNPAFCELMGYTEDELTSGPVYNFIHPDDHEHARTRREAYLRGEKCSGEGLEIRMIAKDGSVKWISWTGRSIPGIGDYVIGRDITEQKAEEAAARQRQALMTTNLKLNAIGLMAANMAHEINNPLTIIYGEGCMLRKMVDQRCADEAKLARIAGNVVNMSERIVSIVKGLRTLARDGSSDPMKSVPLQQIFEDTIPFCRGKITSDGVQLIVEELVPDVYVCCRSVQLSQALLNLLNNAYDAVIGHPGAKRIEVFTRLSPTRVEICVRDSGAGIGPEVREKLFQPFVSSKVAGKGLGLGLSISRSMIEANGGELFLAEACTKTTFVISLPRVLSE